MEPRTPPARLMIGMGSAIRSASRSERGRRPPAQSDGVRRALPFEGSASGHQALVPFIPDQLMEYVAPGRPEPIVESPPEHLAIRRYEVHVDILRSELRAATHLMERREQWWINGLRHAEMNVGMEIDRVRDSELHSAEDMEQQMKVMMQALYATQAKAKNSSLEALDQQRISRELEAYTRRLEQQGRAMIENADHQCRQVFAEANSFKMTVMQQSSELARAKAEAERYNHTIRLECEANDRNNRKVAVLESELAAGRMECSELREHRLQVALEQEISIAKAMGQKSDLESTVLSLQGRVQELQNLVNHFSQERDDEQRNVLQSTKTLQELLAQSQQKWQQSTEETRRLTLELQNQRQEVSAQLRTINRLSVELEEARRTSASTQQGFDAVASLRSELESERASNASVQAEIRAQRAEVSKLTDQVRDLKHQLKEWEDQYDFQFGVEAGPNQKPKEEKRRGDFAPPEWDADDGDYDDNGGAPQRGTGSREAPSAPCTAARQTPASHEPSRAGVDSRLKEAERIKVGGWPKPTMYRKWRMDVTDDMVAASTRPQKTFEWMMKVSDPGVTYDDLRYPGDDMATLDAKLASALAHNASPEFQKTLQTRKAEALRDGRMVAGRQILFMIDQHFKMTEADGSVFDTEHLFSVKMRGERLAEFLTTWDQVIAGLRNVPNDETLLALLMRNLRTCRAMESDIAYFDRLAVGHADKSYEYLLRCARAVVERNRLQWYRDELSRSLTGGWVNVGKGKESKGKGKGKKGKRSSSGNRDGKGSERKGKGKGGRPTQGDRSPSRDSTRSSPVNDVCKMHLKGKCKAGKDCSKRHNPPCRFFQRGDCRHGKDCAFPHHQPAAAATEDDSSKEAGSKDKRARGGSRGRSRQREEHGRSQTPSKASVCVPFSWATGARQRNMTTLVTTPLGEEDSYTVNLGVTGGRSRNIVFGEVCTIERPIGREGHLYRKVGPVIRNPGYRHDEKIRRLNKQVAVEAAVDRAQDLIEEIEEEEFEEQGTFTRRAQEWADKKGEKENDKPFSALPVKGGEWIVDSGSSFDIISPKDMTKRECKEVYALDDSVPLYTAQGEAVAESAVALTPFNDGTEVECLVLPNSPALLSLGRLCMETGCGFHWNKGSMPTLTLPTGNVVELQVVNRVPIWPMERAINEAFAGRVCPTMEGGSSSSTGIAPGGPVPTTDVASGQGKEEDVLLEGEVPPEHYLTHRPKLAKCEACQEAKLYHRQCRRTSGETRADEPHKAKKFGDAITMDHLSSDGEAGLSRSGNSTALVVRDLFTGWIDAYPAGSKCADEVVQALLNFVAVDETVGYVASDGAEEYKAAMKQLGWRHRTSTPGRPQTNGIAERTVRNVLEGTRAVLHQAGASPRWWSKAIRHYCFLHNVSKRPDGDASPWEKRFGEPFTGPLHPFGSEVSYKPAIDDGSSNGRKFEPSGKKGIMMGYFMNPGGKWSKDFIVLDLDAAVSNKDLRRIRTRRVGEVVRARGGPKFPFRTLAQVPLEPIVAEPQGIPEVLRVEEQAAGGAEEPAEPVMIPNPAPNTPPAEPPLTPKTEPAKAKPLPKYTPGQFVDKEALDESRMPAGCRWEEGRITRVRASSRPADVWPEIWNSLTPKEKRELIAARAVDATKPDASAGPPAPVMPVLKTGKIGWPHREKIGDAFGLDGLAMVARPVRPKEIKENKGAQAAMDKEWKALRDLGTWNESKVCEWSDVKASAKVKNVRVHIGMVFGICVEKGSELPEGNPGRKYKGRVVFRGNDVRDESHFLATFQDLGSAPAGMSSGKMIDFLGLLEGWTLEQADATRAYTQAKLSGTPTWVRLPREQWPQEWARKGYKDPVCPLELALYGHPDAGTCWESHCDAELQKIGFQPIVNWSGCYRHTKLRAVLSVYVDDFKLACHKNDVKKVWEQIRAKVKLEDPTKLKQYLGCGHEVQEGCLAPDTRLPGGSLPIPGYKDKAEKQKHDKRSIRSIEYNMVSFVDQCVEAYLKLTGTPVTKLVKAATPFVDETNAYCKDLPEGTLANIALKVLMKILYVARMARPDLLRATCSLARRITKWTTECDHRLHRLVSYMHHTRTWMQYAYVGDKFEDCALALFADADFAGDKTDSISTSGIMVAAVGPRTFVPIKTISKKQTCTSQSTCESEVVAMCLGLKETLPLLDFWETVAPIFCPTHEGADHQKGSGTPEAVRALSPSAGGGRGRRGSFENPPAEKRTQLQPDIPIAGGYQVQLYLFEDNMSTITVLEKGASQKLAHLTRTHRVNLHWMAEVVKQQNVHIAYIKSEAQAADIFTKAFTNPMQWVNLCSLVGVYQKRVINSISKPTAAVCRACVAQLVTEKCEMAEKKKATALGSTFAGPVGTGAEWQDESVKRLKTRISPDDPGAEKKELQKHWQEDKSDQGMFAQHEVGTVLKENKDRLCYVIRATLQRVAYYQGSHELRSAVSNMPFELVALARQLQVFLKLTGRNFGISNKLADELALGNQEPFGGCGVPDQEVVKIDLVGDSSLLGHPGLNYPGVRKAKDGAHLPPVGWTPEVATLRQEVRRHLLNDGAILDVLAEGGATCEGLTRLATEAWLRKPTSGGAHDTFEKVMGRRVTRVAVISWMGNDVATWNTNKNTGKYKAKAVTQEMRESAKKLHDVLAQYSAGIIVGPARAKNWSLDGSWETGADELLKILKPRHFHYWNSKTFWSFLSYAPDGWHWELVAENLELMARHFAAAINYTLCVDYIRRSLEVQEKDGDEVDEVDDEIVTHGIMVKEIQDSWPAGVTTPPTMPCPLKRGAAISCLQDRRKHRLQA